MSTVTIRTSTGLRPTRQSYWDDLQPAARLACIDSKQSRQLDNATAWYPKGEVFQFWNTKVLPTIRDLINDSRNSDWIFGKTRKPRIPLCELYMIGSHPQWEQAKPTIVASSNEPEYTQRMVRLLQESKLLKKTRHGFDFRAHKGKADTRPTADGNGDVDVDSDGDITTLCGARISISPVPGSDDQRWRYATLGGVFTIDDVHYGLTAAHPFFEEDEQPEQEFMRSDDQSVLSATDGTDADSLPSEPSVDDWGSTNPQAFGQYLPNRRVYLDTRSRPDAKRDSRSRTSDPNNDSPVLEDLDLIGQIATKPETETDSAATSWISRENDWALIKISNSRFHLPNNVKLPTGRVIHPRKLSRKNPFGPVVVAAGFSLPYEANCTGLKTGIILPGSRQMVEAWSIDKASLPGDCGSLVLDSSTGSVYAMIVASSESGQRSYCVLMESVIAEIDAGLPPGRNFPLAREHVMRRLSSDEDVHHQPSVSDADEEPRIVPAISAAVTGEPKTEIDGLRDQIEARNATILRLSAQLKKQGDIGEVYEPQRHDSTHQKQEHFPALEVPVTDQGANLLERDRGREDQPTPTLELEPNHQDNPELSQRRQERHEIVYHRRQYDGQAGYNADFARGGAIPRRPRSHERERSRPENLTSRGKRASGQDGVSEKEETIIRRRSHSRSPSPDLSVHQSSPPIIRAPPIHQEVITHHRHIDHGYETALGLDDSSNSNIYAQLQDSLGREAELQFEIDLAGLLWHYSREHYTQIVDLQKAKEKRKKETLSNLRYRGRESELSTGTNPRHAASTRPPASELGTLPEEASSKAELSRIWDQEKAKLSKKFTADMVAKGFNIADISSFTDLLTDAQQVDLVEVVEEHGSDVPYPRRGRTRIPKALVHPRVLLDLGYPYYTNGDNTIVIERALDPTNIDEVVAMSKDYTARGADSAPGFSVPVPPAQSNGGNLSENNITNIDDNIISTDALDFYEVPWEWGSDRVGRFPIAKQNIPDTLLAEMRGYSRAKNRNQSSNGENRTVSRDTEPFWSEGTSRVPSTRDFDRDEIVIRRDERYPEQEDIITRRDEREFEREEIIIRRDEREPEREEVIIRRDEREPIRRVPPPREVSRERGRSGPRRLLPQLSEGGGLPDWYPRRANTNVTGTHDDGGARRIPEYSTVKRYHINDDGTTETASASARPEPHIFRERETESFDVASVPRGYHVNDSAGTVNAPEQTVSEREVFEEADYYNKRALERGYPGEAHNGATRDWGIVDIPPGTLKVQLYGLGGGAQEITWQRHNGNRRAKFMPDGMGGGTSDHVDSGGKESSTEKATTSVRESGSTVHFDDTRTVYTIPDDTETVGARIEPPRRPTSPPDHPRPGILRRQSTVDSVGYTPSYLELDDGALYGAQQRKQMVPFQRGPPRPAGIDGKLREEIAMRNDDRPNKPQGTRAEERYVEREIIYRDGSGKRADSVQSSSAYRDNPRRYVEEYFRDRSAGTARPNAGAASRYAGINTASHGESDRSGR